MYGYNKFNFVYDLLQSVENLKRTSYESIT